MQINGENCFVTLLELLKVKDTKDFSNQYFNEHPHKYNLYGLSKMLSDYGIRNAATWIEDKENDLFNIECPFVAHTGGDFVVVEKLLQRKEGTGENGEAGENGEIGEAGETGEVMFLRNGKKIILPISQFIKSWSGVILIAEPLPDSGESDYIVHRKKDLLTIAQKSILALASILILAFSYIHSFISPASPVSPVSPLSPAIKRLVMNVFINGCAHLRPIMKSLSVVPTFAM